MKHLHLTLFPPNSSLSSNSYICLPYTCLQPGDTLTEILITFCIANHFFQRFREPLGFKGFRGWSRLTVLSWSPLTLILLTWRIWWAPNNASKWQMGFNSAFKGLNQSGLRVKTRYTRWCLSNVYWIVHHCNSWGMKNQLDVTCYLFNLLRAQHVSDINISIFRSLRLCWWVTTSVVLFCKDGCFSN